MIIASLVLSTTLLQVGPDWRAEWDYPADGQAVSIRDFAGCDYIAIARFVERGSMHERNAFDEHDGNSWTWNYLVDRYDIIDCPVGGLAGRVDVVVPTSLFMRRTRQPVAGANYLIIGHKQVNGNLLTYNFEIAYHGAQAFRYRVDSQSQREVSAVLQLRTNANAVVDNSDARARVLLNIIRAIRGASDDDVRRATKILAYTRAKFSLSVSNSSEEQIAGQNASAWYLQALTSTLDQLVPTLSSYGKMRLYELLIREKVPGAVSQYLDLMVRADSEGRLTDNNLFANHADITYEHTSSNRLVDLAGSMHCERARLFVLGRATDKPDIAHLRTLAGMLVTPGLRYTILSSLSRWYDRDDLRPVMGWSGGAVGQGEYIIVNEEVLLRYWREHPPE